MDRESFGSVLEAEYQSTQEQWSTTLLSFGPPARIWTWLQQAENEVEYHHQRIIVFLKELYLRQFDKIKQQLDQLTARKHQLHSALVNIWSTSHPYYHLHHFAEDDFPQYYTDIVPTESQYNSDSSF